MREPRSSRSTPSGPSRPRVAKPRALGAVLLVGVAGCTAPRETPRGGGAAVESPDSALVLDRSDGGRAATLSSPPATPPLPVTLAFLPRRFAPARLAFDGIEGTRPEITAWDTGGVYAEGRTLGAEESLRLLVRAHGDESLDGFERDHGSYRLSGRSPTKVCGRPAVVERAHRDAQHITCVIVAGGPNHPAYVPPTDVVAVAFPQGKLNVVFTVEVEAERPSDYEPAVARILQSIRCR